MTNNLRFAAKTHSAVTTLALSIAAMLALPVQAQTYTRTEQITYTDNTTKWVLGQVAQVKCIAPTTALPNGCGASGTEMSATTYDPTTAVPLATSAFGKVQQTLSYNADGTVATAKDGNNNVTTLTNWKRGIPQNIGYFDGTGISAVVNDAGWITSVNDENAYTTSYTYDGMGRLASTTYPTGDSPAWNTTTQVFEPVSTTEVGIGSGHWRQTVATGNARKITYFDALWRPLVTLEYDTANVAGTQRYQRLAYDAESHTTFASYPGTTDSLTAGTNTLYDSLGRTKKVTVDSELGPLTTLTEYPSGFQTRITTPRNTVTTTTYMVFDKPDEKTWPVSIIQPEGEYTDIPRDIFGKPTAITRHDSGNSLSVTRSYSYNANQELCRTVGPEVGATLSGYDGAGNLAWSAAGLPNTQACEADGTSSAVAARKASRVYDARNRLKTLSFPDGQGNQSWSYTPDGLPLTVSTSNPNVANPVSTTYGYNHRRLLASESLYIAGLTLNTGYGYDSNGHLSSQTYPSQLVVAYAPNALGQPTQAGSFATGVSYYPNGKIHQFTYGNGIVHTTTLNTRQLPSQFKDAGVVDLTYGYDANANVNQITDNIVGGRQTRGLTYDNLDRLTQATSTMWGVANYGYDVLDNITHTQVGASSNYAARDQYYCYVNNLLTSIKTGNCSGSTVISLSYDAQGNLSNKIGQGYVFDYGNRLRNVPGKEWYAYDGQGRRVLSCNTGACAYQQYTKEGQPIYAQDNRYGKLAERIYLSGSLVAIRETPTGGGAVAIKYEHTDELGSPVAATDANKAIVETTEYEPYGAQTNRALTDGPNYTGHVLDASTGLDYMQQRYYDPVVGRFLSVDPVATDTETGKGFGLYEYVANNPYAAIDPDGRDMLVITGGVRDGSMNVFGHSASAVQKNGMSSFGNNTAKGSSVSDYLTRESKVREQTVTVLSTTPKQDAAAIKQIDSYPNMNVGLVDNCAVHTSEVLTAAGVNVSEPFPGGVARAAAAQPNSVTYTIPQNGAIPPGLTKELGKFEQPQKKAEPPKTNELPKK